MKHLKTIFACLLMAVLSIGQVWAADAASVELCTSWSQTFAYATAYTHDYSIDDLNGGTTTMTLGVQGVFRQANANTYFQMNKKTGYFKNTTALPGKITKIETTWNVAKGATKCYFANGAVATSSDATVTVSAGTSVTYTPDNAADYYFFNIDVSTGSGSAQMTSCVVYYEKAGGDPSPSVSVTPASWDFGTVHASDAASKVFSVSGSNLTAGDLTLTVPEGFSVSPSSIAVDGTLTATDVTVSKNTSTEDDYAGNLEITGGGLESAKTVALTMTVDADPAPTGTFELFSGDLEEGDYVFVVNGIAMTNTVSSNRLANTDVTVSGDNKITNPEESIIWHVAASGDYWTIYSAAVEKYAASTGAANKAQMLADGTDDKAKWSVAKTGDAFNFQNKANAAGSVNAKLQRNGDYGWACYSAYSNISLYKKQVEGQPKAPTFSVAGGNYESAQSVEISCETVGATIHYTLDGTKPTSSSPTYSTALNISSTTTVKAIAIKDDIESTVATATYTIVVWQTVDEIWSSITSEGPTNANVWGYVSQANVGGYNNNYYISVDGSLTANQLEIYKGDNAGNTVAVGDKVHVNGDLTIFNEIKEFKQNTGVIVHYAAKGDLQSVAVDGTPTKTEYAANEDFDPAGLKVYGTYANGFVGEITDGITWGNDLTDGKVTENTTVHVTATVSGITNDPAYDVPVTVAAKTLVSIAVGTASYTIYTGEALPQPVVTATFSEGEPENVSAFAVYDTESVFDTEVIDNPNPQTITVSYTFGGETKTTTYTVSVQDYENANDAPYSVTEALHIITAAIGNVESAREIVVTGTVSVENISGNKNRYKISDGVNELLVYAGKGFNNETFTNTNYPKVNDVVKVKGKVINYNNNTPEFVSAKSYLLSQIRPSTIAIEDVASFEVGADDLAEGDLVITTASDGNITFVSGDETKATIVANAIHAVAPGVVTITANLAATENDNALNYAATSTTFSVTVVAPATKYAITFDGNGATGGDAPEFASEAAAGANVTLPANTYTYTGHSFTGWKVYDENEDEVTVTAGAFTMPASPVTIKAQWAEISVWATTYTSNVTLSYTGTGETNSQVKINDEDYAAQKVGSSGNDGSVVVTVPYGTHTLHFHAVAWNGKSVTIAASGVENMSESSFTLTADPGFKSSGTYTLENDPVGQYFVMTFTAVTEETQITFSKTAGDDKRFMLYGVNQEGGQLPVLESIEIKGDLTTKTGYKAGDALNLDGLTVEATYSIGGVAQTPVDITDKLGDGLTLTYDPLVENQTEVTITATYGDKSDDITITGLDPVASADPKIYVSTLNVDFGSVEVGEAVPANETVTVTLTNVASVTATLGGTNADAFSVSPASLTESGDITISILANTDAAASYSATLTISDGAEGAEDKTINLSFEVTEPVVTEEYQLVSDVTSLAAGDQIIIVAENAGDYYTLDGSISSQYFPSTAVSISAGIITAPSTSAIILGKDEDNWTMSMGGQLIGATAAKKASLGNNDASNTWTIAIAENVATITNTTTTYGSLQFNYNNGSNSRFLNYTSTQTAVAIYKKVAAPAPEYETVRLGLEINRYYTVCLPKKVTAIKGATFWTLKSKSQDGATAYLEEETNNLPFAAGTPFIIQATAANLEVVYEGDATEVAGTNGALHGTLVYMSAATLEAVGGSDVYMLYENALRPVGENNHLDANRAYVLLSELDAVAEAPQSAPGKRVRAMPMQPQVVTDIDAINASEKPMKMMINGQLFIIRGEKMYDTTGRLVK